MFAVGEILRQVFACKALKPIPSISIENRMDVGMVTEFRYQRS